MADRLRRLAAEGAIVLLATHDLDLADGLITRLGHGSTAADVWWTLIALVTFAVGMYVARRAFYRSGDLAGVLVCALTGLLISPISP